ncbi:MAG: tRNA (N(6)-L-threonylcarbamoyladenosine(37)-C(2))-methylthiotransferase MtaB, partial [Chloroflexi bacterium]|nr:tRNA (N(6)-L-threonylcarbamoyladenosine(37)-C(2))-methylthiotransferase MtaB [Chloroflexota bacterium]
MRGLKRNGSVTVETLGCKLNQAESESIARQFAAAGHSIYHPSDCADIYILNTCTVTHV